MLIAVGRELSGQLACLPRIKPWVWSSTRHKSGMMVHAWNHSIEEIKAGGSESESILGSHLRPAWAAFKSVWNRNKTTKQNQLKTLGTWFNLLFLGDRDNVAQTSLVLYHWEAPSSGSSSLGLPYSGSTDMINHAQWYLDLIKHFNVVIKILAY